MLLEKLTKCEIRATKAVQNFTHPIRENFYFLRALWLYYGVRSNFLKEILAFSLLNITKSKRFSIFFYSLSVTQLLKYGTRMLCG